MWINKLKIAIVEKDINSMSKLLDDIPKLKDKQEMQTAVYLLKEASSLVESMRDKTKTSMSKIKQNLEFLKSSQVKPSHTLDISL